MSDGWARTSIQDVCESIVDCVNKTAPTVPGPTPYKMIRTTNVKDGWVDLSEVRFVNEPTFAKWTRRQMPRRGDVILTREAPLGEVGMLRADDSIFLGQRLVSYRADPQKLDNRFLLYSFQERDLQAQIRALGSGATVEHMRVPDAEKLTLRMPSLPTQRKIGAVLAAYDDLIENNMRRIAVLEEMARSLYREWFVNFRFPGHESTAMVESPIGTIPDGWQPTTLSDIAGDSRRSVQPQNVDGDTPYVGLEHLPRRSIALQDWGEAASVQSTKLTFDKGDILFGKIRPYFHKVSVAPVGGVCSSDAIVITARERRFYGLTVTCVSSDDFVAHSAQTSQGTKMPRANWDVLLKYPVPLPPAPLLEQFDDVVCGAVEMVVNLVMRNRVLRRTRDLLLPRLISGELDVSDLHIDTGELSA